MVCCFVGLIVISLAIGTQVNDFYGWMCFGIGLVVLGLIEHFDQKN